MNIIKIAKQIYQISINKREYAQQFIDKNLLQDNINANDIYAVMDLAIKYFDVEQDDIINLTNQQLPQKITNIINQLKQQSHNIECFIIYKNEDKYIVDFLLVNGENGANKNHEMINATNEINNIIGFLDSKQADLEDNIYLSIRNYDGDLLDNIYYWIIQFWI